MFHVFKLDWDVNLGQAVLLEKYHDREDAADAVERYSNKYPHAYVDYVYKDV